MDAPLIGTMPLLKTTFMPAARTVPLVGAGRGRRGMSPLTMATVVPAAFLPDRLEVRRQGAAGRQRDLAVGEDEAAVGGEGIGLVAPVGCDRPSEERHLVLGEEGAPRGAEDLADEWGDNVDVVLFDQLLDDRLIRGGTAPVVWTPRNLILCPSMPPALLNWAIRALNPSAMPE